MDCKRTIKSWKILLPLAAVLFWAVFAASCTDANNPLYGPSYSMASNMTYIQGTNTKPGVPTGVQVILPGVDNLRIIWNPVQYALGYRVYFTTNLYNPFVQAGNDTTNTNLLHTGLHPGVTYFYKVSAFNGAGEGVLSGIVSNSTLSSGTNYVSVTNALTNTITNKFQFDLTNYYLLSNFFYLTMTNASNYYVNAVIVGAFTNVTYWTNYSLGTNIASLVWTVFTTNYTLTNSVTTNATNWNNLSTVYNVTNLVFQISGITGSNYLSNLVIQSSNWNTNNYALSSSTTNTAIVYFGSNWVLAKNVAGFDQRAEFASTVFNNSMWLMGGNDNSGLKNDVYFSQNGTNWSASTLAAGFSARKGMKAAVYRGSIWMVGGSNSSGALSDVWFSQDGTNWNQSTSSAAFGAISGESLVTFNDSLWVIGGNSGDGVWYSKDGTNWNQVTTASFPGRSGALCLVCSNNLYLIGGYNGSYKSDVYYSPDGTNWIQTTSLAVARAFMQGLTFRNSLWAFSGATGNGDTNDILESDSGAVWNVINSSAPFTGRANGGALVFQKHMWLFGGINSGNLNDVWESVDTNGTPPEVDFTMTNIINTNQTVTVNASGSYTVDGGALQYSFNFGDGSSTGWQSGSTATHSWSTLQAFPVTVSVMDASGLVSSNVKSINVQNGIPPVAVITTISPLSGNRSTVFSADASGVSDPIQSTGTLQVRWIWGDGTTNAFNTIKSATHTYSNAPGNYAIILSVLDSLGNIVSVSTNVTVTNRPPTVTPWAYSWLQTNDSVTLFATNVQNPDGNTLQYAWDIGNGAGLGNFGSANTVTTSYPSSGDKVWVVQVEDPYGGLVSVTNVIHVINTPVVAPAFNVNTLSNYRGGTFSFDASPTVFTNYPGNTMQYAWNWGDGTTNAFGTSTSATHSYSSLGTNLVTLYAMNANGYLRSVSTNLVITDRAPSGVIYPQYTYIQAGDQDTLYLSNIVDPDGDSVTQSWNGGDGNGWGAYGLMLTNSFTYNNPGDSIALVQLKDSYGMIGTNSNVIHVLSIPLISPNFTVSTLSNYRGGNFSFNANITTFTNFPGNSLQYQWVWGDGNNSTWSATTTATHSYTSLGSNLVVLSVRDVEGYTKTWSTNLVITDRAPVAVFTNGLMFKTNQNFLLDATGSTDPDGDSLQYSWNLGGLGFSTFSASATLTTNLTVPGSNQLVLQVMDTYGATNNYTNWIYIAGTAIWGDSTHNNSQWGYSIYH
jgi:hypothetical protein